jgi:hypothetical protein
MRCNAVPFRKGGKSFTMQTLKASINTVIDFCKQRLINVKFIVIFSAQTDFLFILKSFFL